MAEPTDSSLAFFTKATAKQWAHIYELRDAAIRVKAEQRNAKKNGPEEFIKLDTWFREKLPAAIATRKDAHLKYDELVLVAKWRLMMGKYRPKLLDLVRINTELSVNTITRKAYKKLSVAKNLQQAITMMVNLKGIGPSTASAVLAVAFPESAPFMSDEGKESTPGVEATDSTIAEYINYSDQLRIKTEWLQSFDPEFKWTPHKVDQVLWIYHLLHDLRPTLLDSMPRGDEAMTTSITTAVDSSGGSSTQAAATSSSSAVMDGGALDDNANDCSSSPASSSPSSLSNEAIALSNGHAKASSALAHAHDVSSDIHSGGDSSSHPPLSAEELSNNSASIPYSDDGVDYCINTSTNNNSNVVSLHHHLAQAPIPVSSPPPHFASHHLLSVADTSLNGHHHRVQPLIPIEHSPQDDPCCTTTAITSSSNSTDAILTGGGALNANEDNAILQLDTAFATNGGTKRPFESYAQNDSNSLPAAATNGHSPIDSASSIPQNAQNNNNGATDDVVVAQSTVTGGCSSEENSLIDDGVATSLHDDPNDQVVGGGDDPPLKKQKTSLELASALAVTTGAAEE